MTPPELKYGVTRFTVGGATGAANRCEVEFRVWRDDVHCDHVMAIVNDRDAGSFSGHIDVCRAWVAGWINGRLSLELHKVL